MERVDVRSLIFHGRKHIVGDLGIIGESLGERGQAGRIRCESLGRAHRCALIRSSHRFEIRVIADQVPLER